MTRHADFFAGPDTSLRITSRPVPGRVIGVGASGASAVPGPSVAGGTVIAVVSATGGCGKTFLATNLAYHLASQGKRTCLLDLDLQFGEVSAALHLEPRHTIRDLIDAGAGVAGEEFGRLLETHLAVHESGIRVLAAPRTPEEAGGIGADHLARVIEAARTRFEYVIVDAPAALGESVLVSIELADRLYAIALLDLPSVRNLGVMLATLRRLQVPEDRIHLLLNKVEGDVGIDVRGVRRLFSQGFSMVIPYGREVNRALNVGRPLLAEAPGSPVGRALAAGLAELGRGPRRSRPSRGGWRAPGGTAGSGGPRRRASRAGRRTRAAPPRRP